MGRRKRNAHALKWCSFFASVAVLALIRPASAESDTNSVPNKEEAVTSILKGDGISEEETLPHCSETKYFHNSYNGLFKRDIVLVSTLDGKISALDLKHSGQVLWSLDAGSGPLLSSSIDKLEIISENGRRIRLVPSLDGGLYSWDTESVEALPFTADSLLGSSFKLNDDSMIVGGKETRSYGISASTGQLRYICSSNGCENFGEERENEDIVVIRRDQQTVRAVEQRSGAEKWNFSVGQHEIQFLKSIHSNKRTDENSNVCDEDGCHVSDYEYEYDFDFDDEDDVFRDPKLNFVVSDGHIAAFNQQKPNELLWQQKLSSAIASAWKVKDGAVEAVNLFEPKNVPALSMDRKPQGDSELGDFMKPKLYMGMYQKQVYIQQESRALSNEVEKVANSDAEDEVKLVAGPKVLWRPYIATAPSRTPALISHATGQDDDDEESQTLATLHQYPYDSGYYLYSDQSPVKVKPKTNKRPYSGGESNESIGGGDYHLNILIATSMWDWWKEILQASVVISIIFELVKKKLKKTLPCNDTDVKEESSTNTTAVNNNSDLKEYRSRYLEDFEQEFCLGKGGFGVVFHAKNKLDDNCYAVKRITLPDREAAREKVMREVKALAKLEHNNIVRYYATWKEEPPLGWQEEQDRLQGHSDTRQFNTFTDDTKNTSNIRNSANLVTTLSHDHSEDTTKPFGGAGDIADSLQSNSDTAGASGGFVPGLFINNAEDEESGSWSIDHHGNYDAKGELEATESSFGIDFRETSESVFESSGTSSGAALKNIPFTNYAKNHSREKVDSFSVVFEDSGCGDKLSEGATDSDCNTNTKQEMSHSSSLKGVIVQRSEGQKLHAGEQQVEEKKPKQPTKKAYLYIQMQLCQKQSLKEWLLTNCDNRNTQQALHIFQQIVSAVQYVHDVGMIHRDLKPSNIFFALDGCVKVGDFGLVTAMDIQPGSGEAVDVTTTEKKHTDKVGTQLYMSPEQIAGKQYGHKVDIFSLGLIFFELMNSFSTQMERIMVMMAARRQDFPQKFLIESSVKAKFAMWLLSLNPDKRPEASDITESEHYREVFQNYVPPKPKRRRNTSSCSE